MITFAINGRETLSDQPSDTPLLWVIRDELGLRSCVTPVSAVQGKRITTIEGLSADGDHPLQKAWIAEQVPQCGYCQSGQIMAAAALLARTKSPTREQIVQHMSGNLCRCGTYNQIVAAIQRAAREA